MGIGNLFWMLPIAAFALLIIALVRYSMKQTAKAKAEWQRFADTVGAAVEKGRFGVNKVVAPARQWSVTIDTYMVSDGETSTTYTRMLLPYTPTKPFYFLLRPRARTPAFLAKISTAAHERVLAKLPPDQRACYELNLRGEEILFADPALDGRYLLRATDPELARRIFAQPTIRRLLAEQKYCTLALKPANMDKQLANTVPALGYTQVGILSSVEALRSAYDLMVGIMEEMNRLELAATLIVPQYQDQTDSRVKLR
jgi:hypothetical protein